jgi:hypothetical protein
MSRSTGRSFRKSNRIYQLLDPWGKGQGRDIHTERNPESMTDWFNHSRIAMEAQYHVTGRTRQCSMLCIWDIEEDVYELHALATPSMDEKKRPTSRAKGSVQNDIVVEKYVFPADDKMFALDPFTHMVVMLEVTLTTSTQMPFSRITAIPSRNLLRGCRPGNMPTFAITREGHEDDMKAFFGGEFVKHEFSDRGPLSGLLSPRTEELVRTKRMYKEVKVDPVTQDITLSYPEEPQVENKTETPQIENTTETPELHVSTPDNADAVEDIAEGEFNEEKQMSEENN